MNEQCKLCQGNFLRLSNHVKRTHMISYEDYLIKFTYLGIRPLCHCGCGAESPFTKSHGESFKDFVHGHHAKGRKKTIEEKRKIGDKNSITISQKYVDGTMKWSKGIHVSSKTGKKSYYRSSWELRHMMNLDVDTDVIWWEYEPIRIEYSFEGKSRMYVPDFVVHFTDRKELQEVGVKEYKEIFPKNIAKRAAAEEYCKLHGWSFKIVSF